jgi:anti-sigma-K factor RskA
MSRNPHALFRENIPAYALGALDANDSAALATHLKSCTSCRDELVAYQALGDGLLMAIPPQAPPVALRKNLKIKLPSARKASNGLWTWPFGPSALAIGFVALLLLNIFMLFQMQSFQRQQALLSSQLQSEQTALALLSYPGIKTIPINANGITGTLLLDDDRNAVALFAWNLPQLPANQTYQAWLIDSQEERISLGVFRPDPTLPFTSFSIISSNNIANFVGIGVTVEPSGGSNQPTGRRLFRVGF